MQEGDEMKEDTDVSGRNGPGYRSEKTRDNGPRTDSANADRYRLLWCPQADVQRSRREQEQEADRAGIDQYTGTWESGL